MKLYYSKSTCSLAVRITLHEIGVECEFEAVDLRSKKTESGKDFLTINPKGAVPTLVFDNQIVLTENTVIQQYLAELFNASQLLPPSSDFKRYRVLEWLNFVSTDLHKNCAPFFNPNMPDEVKHNVFKPILINKFGLVDTQLAYHKYLAGDNFTLADSYLYVVLRWLPFLGIDRDQWPNISRYFSEVEQRPAVIKALNEEGLK